MAGREHALIEAFLLAASKEGWRFARNNQGLAKFDDGSTVRYGLFQPGGSDVIGLIPKLITSADVGRRLAIFAAVEMKTGKQSPTDDQAQFLRMVTRAGGIATWGRDLDPIMRKIQGALA